MEQNQRVEQRAAEILPEESAAGADDPRAVADAVLAESDERQMDRSSAPGTVVEHRRSEDA